MQSADIEFTVGCDVDGADGRMRLGRTWILVAALVASWGLFAVYYLARAPIRSQAWMMRLHSMVYEPGPTIIVGDSLLAALPAAGCAFNLAVPGRRAAELDAADIASRAPSRVILKIGINDLRAGASPAEVTNAIGQFVRVLKERRPQANIMVLAILPIVDGTFGQATNSAIRETNAAVRASVLALGARHADLSGLFGGDALTPTLTYDGVHLNAAGLGILTNALFQGLGQNSSAPLCPRT